MTDRRGTARGAPPSAPAGFRRWHGHAASAPGVRVAGRAGAVVAVVAAVLTVLTGVALPHAAAAPAVAAERAGSGAVGSGATGSGGTGLSAAGSSATGWASVATHHPSGNAAVGAVATPHVVSGPARTADLPEPTWTPPEVRDAADDVLDGAEFQRPEPNLLERARAWVEERIGRVLQGLVTGDGASVLGWIVLLASVVAIGLLLARFSRSVQRDPARAAAVSVERARTAAQWAEEAERLEAEQEWKSALRCRFRSLVASLVDHGRVDDVPGRTAGEYRAEVDAGLPEAAADFAEATYLFEDAWYGDQPTGRAENERFRALAAAVLAASAEHRSEGPAGPVVTEAEAVSA
ncbi:MAG: DUF4129 domain-containing protein [Acidimicrobiales bacterium]|nr:DUF4129 domain-containing protein [Acidimicrobiales bacterium]